MKYYGTNLCPDCVAANDLLKNTSYDWVDITASTANLKEFLALRDHREEFADIKAQGGIGIPCFLMDDGRIEFDPEIAARHEPPAAE